MQPVNLKWFRRVAAQNKRRFRHFLTRLGNNPPRHLDTWAIEVDKQVWQETDCLSCANCCKTMSPTYTNTDIRRISSHLKMTEEAFREKYLYKERSGDWMNTKQPCFFLDLKTNMCKIYAVRPADCAGFPHLTKKKMKDYVHVHHQNVVYCPAAYRMVELMMEKVQEAKG